MAATFSGSFEGHAQPFDPNPFMWKNPGPPEGVWTQKSEGVSTGVWCVPGFGAGFEIALEPSKLQKEGENSGKGQFYFLRQTLVCTKPWFK